MKYFQYSFLIVLIILCLKGFYSFINDIVLFIYNKLKKY